VRSFFCNTGRRGKLKDGKEHSFLKGGGEGGGYKGEGKLKGMGRVRGVFFWKSPMEHDEKQKKRGNPTEGGGRNGFQGKAREWEREKDKDSKGRSPDEGKKKKRSVSS